MASAIVVGAGSGIGRALVLALADRGWRVAAVSRDPGRLETLRGESTVKGAIVETFPCDVADPTLLADVLHRSYDELGSVSLVVHTAGTAQPIGPVWECDVEVAMKSLAVMAGSAWTTVRTCVPFLLDGGRGSVLVASSGAASKPAVGRSIYSMSKAAVDQLVRVVGAELRALEADVGVAAFYPGMVATAMQHDMRAAAQRYRSGPFAPALEPFLRAPADDLLTPQFVAERIAHLAGGEPRSLNGLIWRLRDSQWVAGQ